ncbi:MAG TPA: hypothetical protein VJP86_00045, partial [Vicinamibacterales bacterium]|nr:hypothetical protein [Vicinamibacterales bacterium]
LSGLDDDTLQFVGERPSLIAALAQIEVAPVFAAFGSSIRIKNGVVVPSGGEPMMALWQAALREDSGRTEPFVLAILTKYEGRLAYLYDLISQLDARHAAFATAASIDNARIRAERFAAFADFVAGSLATWQVRAMPFTRPIDDVAWLLLNTVVDERGTVAASLSSQLLWMRIFESSDVPDRKDAAAIFRNAGDRVDIDAVWLALNVLTAEPRVRAVRLRQLAFAMRTLSSATTSDAEVLTAVRGFARYPALMLTLERAGVASPGVFADAARRADRLARLDGADAYVAFRQFQGAIALIERMARVGSINAERTEALVSGLAAIDSDGNGHYNGTLAAWTREQLVPSLEEESTAEDALIAQLSGSGARRQNAALERVNWEGEQYRLDLAMAESRRLHELRQKLRGVPLDASLDLEAAAQQLQDRSLDLDRLSAAVATVKKVQQSLGDARFADTKAGDGLELPSPPAVLDRAVQELSRITRPQDVRDAADVGKSLLRLSGQLLGETLASFSYLVNIDTTAEGSEQAGELSLRHEFGLALKEAVDRRQTPWVLSRQVIQTGVPRHVQGSLFGLDVAFARTAMRQVVMDSPGGAPGLMSNDRETFVRSVALLNPSLMENDERDQIARALARGRTRVAEAAASAAELTALAEEVGMDGWRRRAMNWERARDASRIASFFTLNELFVLGRTGDAVPQWKLDAWGMSGMPLSGCLCTRLLPPNIWRVLGGRPQAGSLGAAIPELNLHVAEMLSALR